MMEQQHSSGSSTFKYYSSVVENLVISMVLILAKNKALERVSSASQFMHHSPGN